VASFERWAVKPSIEPPDGLRPHYPPHPKQPERHQLKVHQRFFAAFVVARFLVGTGLGFLEFTARDPLTLSGFTGSGVLSNALTADAKLSTRKY
jgi:hypothetical protein